MECRLPSCIQEMKYIASFIDSSEAAARRNNQGSPSLLNDVPHNRGVKLSGESKVYSVRQNERPVQFAVYPLGNGKIGFQLSFESQRSPGAAWKG